MKNKINTLPTLREGPVCLNGAWDTLWYIRIFVKKITYRRAMLRAALTEPDSKSMWKAEG